MKFGICPTPHPWWKSIKQLRDWIVEVERLGFDGVFMPDHHSMMKPMSDEVLDAWTTLSFFAAATSKLRLGTDVTPIPRWVPSQLAKVIATVDVLSNGRVIAGFGAGSIPDEFVNYSPQGLEPPPVRVKRFSEGLQLILKLWTEEKTNFEGKYYKAKDAVLLPKPVQKPHPPIWSGGQGPLMLKITAKYFDGWVFPRLVPGMALPPELCESRIRIIRKHAKDYGRDLTNFTFGVLGSITDSAEVIEAYRQLGCQYYIVELFKGPGLSNPFPADEYISASRKFAEEIIPSFT
ncbi:MAG: LLM class flavin-dependent oxidoreductase [Candidatus Bathyarchaeia archaeon]